jgi:hypothetical protein
MANQYITNFQTVSDGETVTINPQNLVKESGVISVSDAQIQWRGNSSTSRSTDSGNKFNSDSDRAEVTTENTRSVNSASATSQGTTDRVTEPFTVSNYEEGQFGSREGEVFAEKPDIPNGGDVDSITIKYHVIERSGGDEYGVDVAFDDDPLSLLDYDDSRTNISVDGFEEKNIFNKTFTSDYFIDYSRVDGAQAKLTNSGEAFGTVGIAAEIVVQGTKVSFEQDINRSVASTSFPDVAGLESHELEVYQNGDLVETQEYPSAGKVGDTVSRISPNSDGGTVAIKCISYGEIRQVDPAELSVTFPNVPSGYNFDNHDIHRDGYGDSFEFIGGNSEGETITETVSDPTKGEVELELETEYSRTITNTQDSVNPTIEGDYIEEGFNTDQVLFVMDKSESVSGSDRKRIAKDILSNLPDSTTASLLSFNFNAELNVPPSTLSDSRSIIEQEIDNLPAEGGTDIQNAVDFARDNIGDSDNEGTIILITDGNNFTEAAELAPSSVNFDFISIGVSDDINTEFLTNLTSLLNGVYFQGSINETKVSRRLNNNEITPWVDLSGFTSGEQQLTHSVEESGKVDFRIRFNWVFETPEPIYGRTGFYDESAGVWRECVVTDVNSNSLEYNHVTVYNDDKEDWGALDVVDTTNSAAIEAFAFYDEDAGWLAPREYNTV